MTTERTSKEATMTQTIDQLNSFLRGEMSAVETHKMAIEKLSKSSFASVLRDTLASHEMRVRSLTAEIIKHGGKPSESSGAWGTFAKLVEGGAAAFGEKAAVAALEEGEDHGRNDYQRELENIEGPSRAFVQSLLTEQLKSHDALSKLKKTMAGTAPTYPHS